MRTHLLLLTLSSALVIAPAACGSSSNGSGTTGDDGGSEGGSGGSSGAGSSSGTGSSSGSTGSSSGAGSSSGSTGSSSGGTGSSSGAGSSSGTGGSSGSSSGGTGGNHIKHIFLIVMENNNWSSIKGSSSAPYINGLISNAQMDQQVSWCSNYYDNPAANHPSEPNYIWLEAATDTFPDDNDTWKCDCDPSSSNSTASTGHLATLLSSHGHTWHEYAEGATAGTCPVSSSGLYAAKHVPFVFFQDVSGNPPSSTAQTCTANVFPYTQLATDLQSGNVADYNFITPNLCDDMHGSLPTCGASISNGDTWLSQNVPTIMASNAYKDGGAIFITWDESEGGENPIGMIVLSPLAKGNGYQSTIKYYHSSMVRTVQEVFLPGVPLLNDAANQPPLSDLFAAGMYP